MAPLEESHIPYLYAAYRREPDPDAPIGMKAPEFTEWVIKHAAAQYDQGHELVVFLGEHYDHGRIPVGMAVVEYHGKIAYPHAWWFPEASPRNKLEIGLLFLLELKKHHVVMIMSSNEHEKYFNFLCSYGAIRKVGKLHDWYEKKKHAMLYQSVGD